MKRLAFIFPGQGAQSVGMGKDFYEAYPLVKHFFEDAGDVLKRNLFKTMFDGPEDELSKTIQSQPSLYIHSVALYKLLKTLFPGISPLFTAGLSLGEYSALVAAEIIDPMEGLKVVDKRGKLMSQACEEHPGTMAVILGLNQEEVESLVKEVNLPSDLWAANFNSPGQIVISGTLKGIEAGKKAALAKGAKKVLPLAVQGAFHSGLMKKAQEELKEDILSLKVAPSSIKVAMNATGRFYNNEGEIRDNLIAQMVMPVRWQESIELIDPLTDLFIELGSGKTLSGLNKRIGAKAETVNLSKVEDIEQIAKEIA